MRQDELERHLTRGGVVRGPGPGRKAFLEAAAALGIRAVVVDCRGAATKAALLRRIAEALRFPAHFGMNLDALHDSLTDWVLAEASGGAAILLEHARANEAGAGRAAVQALHATVLDALAGSVELLAERTVRLTVFVG
jgi:RNAse (barnase) inhibitor barstar